MNKSGKLRCAIYGLGAGIALVGLVCTTYILPNTVVIDNIRHHRTMYEFDTEDIHEVPIENAREIKPVNGVAPLPVTGCYLRCMGQEIHDLVLYSKEQLVCGEVNLYYILQESEEYSEKQCLQRKLIPYGDGYAVTLRSGEKGICPYGIRIDLAQFQGEVVHLTGVAANAGQIRVLWQNAVPWLIAFFLFLVFMRGKYRHLVTDIYENRNTVRKLAVNDLRARYAGSAFGRIWAFVQPALTILVMWYVFQVGFRNPPVKRIPFIIWFMAGYVPWMYFSDTITGMTNVICDYSYLVKKISFRVSLLPVVRLLSGMLIHIFFLAAMAAILIFYGYNPDMIWLQAVYYSFSLSVLLFSLGLLFSAMAVLLRDFSHVIAVILQVLFWYTPIVWNYEDIADNMIPVFSVNPLFYIVDGYRKTFIDHRWMWENAAENMRFWIVAAVLFCIAVVVFERCRPHFADVL